MTLKEINAAISNYEARLQNAVSNAADSANMPGVTIISGLRNDLTALLVIRKDAEEAEALERRLETEQ